MALADRTSPGLHLAIAVACLVGLVTGCRHQEAPPLVTPAAALQVLQTNRELNDRANSTLDVGLEDQHESGAAAQIDDNAFRQLQQAGKTAIPEPFQESQLEAFVPVQSRYPAEFLGEWTETSAQGHGRSLGLFVKAAPDDRWRVSLFIYQPSDSPDRLPDLTTDKHGYARRLTAAELGHLSVSPALLASNLSAFWNGYRDASAPSSIALAPGNWTTGRNERVRQDLAHKAAQNLDETWEASTGPFHYGSAYRTRSGDALVFFSVIEHITVSARSPLSFVTPLSYRGQQVLPLAVTKGAHVLSLDVLYTIAALVGPGSRPPRVIGGYSGPIAAARAG
jgi:hypothetical protein